MKLELKHIQHYPMGGDNALRVQRVDKSIHKINGIIDGLFITTENGEDKYIAINGNYNKPLLRPMSDLYREIDGKIGIVEIYNLLFGRVFNYKIENETLIIIDDFFGSFIEYPFEWIQETMSFKFQGSDLLMPIKVFEYFFSRHYDIYGLIGQKLAIDKNSIEDEKI